MCFSHLLLSSDGFSVSSACGLGDRKAVLASQKVREYYILRQESDVWSVAVAYAMQECMHQFDSFDSREGRDECFKHLKQGEGAS